MRKLVTKKNILPFFLLIAVLFACSPVFALEQAYPEVDGINLEKVTRQAEPLPKVIKYFTTWAIVIALACVLGALIYAGIMYLVSSGKPEKARTAKDKVKKGFLGLAILAVSYLALQFVNPSLTIMQIQRRVVESGVVLITKQGYDILKDQNSQLSVMDLVDENQAFILTIDSFDLREQLGPLVVEEWTKSADNQTAVVKSINFGNIPLYGLLFWGKLANEARVFAYPLINHQVLSGVNPFVYDKKGKIVNNVSSGAEIITKSGTEMSVIPLDVFGLQGDAGKSEFYPILIGDYQSLSEDEQKNLLPETRNVLSPPLSIAIKTYAPGVYLYGPGSEELYLTQTEQDLANRDFSQKATSIRLQNTESILINGDEGDYFGGRYFAVLFSDRGLKGDAKVFFPESNPDSLAISAVEFNNQGLPLSSDGSKSLNELLAEENANNPGVVENLLVLNEKTYYTAAMQSLRFTSDLTRGNITDNINPEKISPNPPTAEANKYGALDKVDSIGIWQFSESPSVCQKVALCTEKGGTAGEGDCLVYLNPTSPDYLALKPRQAVLPMPFYEPIVLPDKVYVYKPELKTADIKEGQLVFVLTDFRDKIKSIETEPSENCLVGLFENEFPLKADQKPGMSRFFDKSVFNLKDDPIDKCGSILSFNKYTSQSCASSIVVYPLIAQATPLVTTDTDLGDFASSLIYDSSETITKVRGALKNFDASLVQKIEDKIKASALKGLLGSQKISANSAENIDPCLFVQMMIIQESLGKKDACGKDKGNSVGCGLLQYKCDSAARSCSDCTTCNGRGNMFEIETNLNKAISDKLIPYWKSCGASAAEAPNLSCNLAKSNQFWPYYIINYNAGPGANKPSIDCKEPCSAYSDNENGGCFISSALQGVAYPNKVECPIRRNDYNITYRYVLTIKDGYEFLNSLYKANPADSRLATCR